MRVEASQSVLDVVDHRDSTLTANEREDNDTMFVGASRASCPAPGA